MRLRIPVLLALLMLLATSLPLAAQDVVVDGLVNPRGLGFDSDGNLYVVEAGNGGDFEAPGGTCAHSCWRNRAGDHGFARRRS